MSGLVAVWHRDGATVDPARASAMLAALVHRGPDGHRLLARPTFAIGHQHFWTTPEEKGEDQPISNQEVGLVLAFDGRLDNRGDLLASLGKAESSVSDAALILESYGRWGEACFERFLGPSALVIFDSRRQRLVAARDAMGSRTLYYRATPQAVLVASEECALVANPDVDARLNQVTLAEFFAVTVPRDGSTFFAEIMELPPGHMLVVSRESLRLRRYWVPDTERRIHYRSDAGYADHFRSLLAESVRCRLRTTGSPGVMMSGGMDSTSVAAVAARELERRGPGRLLSFSWVFDELTECDERRWIGRMVERFGLDATFLPADGDWTLRDADQWPVGKNQPWANCYELMKQRLYRAAASRGCRSLLNGVFADCFYTGYEEWLTDLIREGRVLEAGRGLLRLARGSGWTLSRDTGVRRLGRRILRPPGECGQNPQSMPWLTPYARRLASREEGTDPAAANARRPEQFESLFGPFSSLSGNMAQLTNGCGIELRDPFRDRRLVEFMLAIPAHQLFSAGWVKHIQRNAMADVLPAEITARTEVTSLAPLLHRGLLDRSLDAARAILSRKDALWRLFVSEAWMREAFPDQMRARDDGAAVLVPWQCISAQLWSDALASRTVQSKIKVDFEAY